jgi:hypothetical protein
MRLLVAGQLAGSFPIAVLVAAVAACACSTSTTSGGDVPYEVPNAGGKLHGEPCDTGDECAFNTCYKAKTATGGTWGICTKDCTGTESQLTICSKDDTATMHYTCARFGQQSGESMLNYCVPSCATVDDCTAIDPRYTACGYPVGATKFCHVL